jgi:pyridoxine 5'-phosphate synthase PdxJ
MAVHVDEIHTDVRRADDAAPAGVAASGSMNQAADSSGVTIHQRWRESRGHIEWVDRRVAAEGFDD